MAYFDPETLRLRSATTQEIVDAYTRRRVLTRLNLSPLEPRYGTLVLDAVGSGRFSPTDVQISVQGALDLTDWLTSAVVGFEVVGDTLRSGRYWPSERRDDTDQHAGSSWRVTCQSA